ncbi:hypothetical protein BP00DRAFT_456208 [Aspergillus indologenus CBS 114.80]|uniref:Uncharacterized protein n=1 Tax=Aspergillus indologenus CBS 114.80 TaxID=1450541 RepID=A0A2V5I6Y8_9EURO|nr:hypothetical protein BP00DRAFT_456208 [Aspergillus indologenus CBS 114.80]
MSYKELFTMSFVAVDAPNSTPDQYANGRMPARVRVAIRILDSDDSRIGKLGSREFDGKFHYSNRGSDTKRVDFRAVEPRRYDTKDLDIEEVGMDSKDFFAGTYWVQTNTYISNLATDHLFVKVQPWKYHSDSDEQPGWGYCWMVQDGQKESMTTRHWYTWPTGETKRTVGSRTSRNRLIADIYVNQQSYAACVTLFETYPKEALLAVPGWEEEGRWIKVWDKYGNFAAFTLGTNDKKTHLVVKDRTVTAEVETMGLPTDEMPAWVKDLPTDVQGRLPELSSQELTDPKVAFRPSCYRRIPGESPEQEGYSLSL